MKSFSSRSRPHSKPVKKRICFVTEADLDRRGFGGITTDQQMLRCLREFGEVDIIYLQRIKYKSTGLALIVFFFQILKSFSKHYDVYFSRGLTALFLLVTFRRLTFAHSKIVRRGLSVPLGSLEVKYLRYGLLESFIRYSFFRFVEGTVLPRVDAVTVAAEEYAKPLINIGLRPDRIYAVPFYVDEEFFCQPITVDRDETFKFCYVGGFHLYHEIFPLIQAFEIIAKLRSDVELLLIGDGLLRPKIENEVKQKKLQSKVKFLGKFPHSSIPRLLSKCDCYVLLTPARGLPIGLLEAAASGKAILSLAKAEDVAFNRFFRHRKEIYTVNSLQPKELSKAMLLLAEDSHLRGRLAENARKVAKQHFSRQNTLWHLDQLFRRVA